MRLGICILLCGGALLASLPELSSAQRKAAAIEDGHFSANGVISFNSQELIALAMDEAQVTAPGAITHPALSLARNTGTATALIDFDKLRQTAHSSSTNSAEEWLYSQIVTGVHPVTVSVNVVSANGTMTVHPVSVTVSAVTLSGSALDFLINSFLLPRYPDAAINRPFRLDPHIDHVEVNPQGVNVFQRRYSAGYLLYRLPRQADAIGNANSVISITRQKQTAFLRN